MAELKTSLERLAKLATRLNTETDQVNVLIDGVDEKLSKLSLGVSLWLENEGGWPLTVGDVAGEEPTYGEQLGYAKVGDKWRLAVRSVAFDYKTLGEDEGYVDMRTIGEPKPLLEASRLARVEACGHLALLVDTLATKVEGFLQALEVAKTAAAKQ
jgi:hypothetical protein